MFYEIFVFRTFFRYHNFQNEIDAWESTVHYYMVMGHFHKTSTSLRIVFGCTNLLLSSLLLPLLEDEEDESFRFRFLFLSSVSSRGCWYCRTRSSRLTSVPSPATSWPTSCPPSLSNSVRSRELFLRSCLASLSCPKEIRWVWTSQRQTWNQSGKGNIYDF